MAPMAGSAPTIRFQAFLESTMRHLLYLVAALLLAAAATAQTDPLEGIWEGTVQAPQGERPARVVFKKEGAGYKGTITGLRGDMELRQIKVEGNRILADAQVE